MNQIDISRQSPEAGSALSYQDTADAAPGPTAEASSAIAKSAAPPRPDRNAKRPFPAPAPVPTQAGPQGIRFDFNEGARLTLPEGKFQSKLFDRTAGSLLFQTDKGGVSIRSSKQYFVRFGIEVRDEAGTLVLSHDYDCKDRDVLITLPVGTIGDSLGWMPYAARFRDVHGCRLTVALAKWMIPIFKDSYPDIRFVTHEGVEPDRFYATYNIGLFFDDTAFEHQPTDFRHVGLHRTAGYILGVDPTEEPPRITVEDDTPPLDVPYVCIAVQASTHAKKWLNPRGWLELVKHVKSLGYEVVCIDREAVHGDGLHWVQIPNGARDETGDRPLTERARWLKHATCFIGLASGLSWLAWGVGCPVVMISGFSHPDTEFAAAGRVINWHTCNSCWNDVRHRFDHHDYLWCPRHKDTNRQFECTRLISSEQVIAVASKLLPKLASLRRTDRRVLQPAGGGD